jgi:C-terminal processing protease CtpA/Prc
MKNYKALILLLIISFSFFNCFEDGDDVGVTANEINDFVWKGMNLFYLYKDDIPDLANTRFSNDAEYASFLNTFSTPPGLFESLVYDRQNVDRFSFIFDDYIALEQLLSGVSVSNGMEFQVFRFSLEATNRYGIVTHVLPNSDAAAKGVKRGDIFYGVNGTQLTGTNLSDLLNQDNYTINMGTYNDNGTEDPSDDTVVNTSESIPLSKSQFAENPIHVNTVLDVNSTKIGYLMYNGFTGTETYNNALNTAFAGFKSAGINELVVDLRYNPGGSVESAILLGSLITGQFNGDVFSKEQWNSEFQEAYENQNPEALINNFVSTYKGASLNSLNLSKVYILTTGRSASASELVINSLRPYIDVVQIGTTTTGKYQASTRVYDSANFGREGANPGHTYVMLPLIYKSLNAQGNTDYFNGLEPDILISEIVRNLGVLGDANEPFLAAAIADITGEGRFIQEKKSATVVQFTNSSKDYIPNALGMYTNKEIPLGLLNR